MKRILYMVLRNIFLIPYLWIKLCYYAGHVEKYTEEERYRLLRYITYRANKGGNVRVESYGTEHLPKEGGFMFFPNHQGLYDVLAITQVCEIPFSVVAKKEVANVPFLKQVFACMKAYMLDREDVRQAMKVILEVSKEVKNGRNYLIFPEGTRSKEGNKVQEFKGGSFKAATKAGCPIVPVALIDAFVPFDRNTIRQTTVQVHFLPPLYPEEYERMNTNELAREVRERIVKTIEANKKENKKEE
ncbi:1-acyl-sn-glycerol-3-phosphate acyltransferase [Clostridiaceae bacterium 68-1-5]|uniref:1-acyl-sn-glycerol-3-phosphate acyltransferase n=1 Tax=Suipraeoptans intestinalis TaxID=2606628 RepID=A0A6N7USH9_9FIRM|nr:lysophospholipid acyltransferase family protein [Suipraeoptans intestinalis]MSR93931.1 1-acyl-sn-glycerol-3-phosphate acyltransferase [Suipraeoptans intestinalis]